MRPADLLRVGQMVLAKGVWQGRQIVPAKWLEQSTTRAVVIDGPFGYGRHWYLLTPEGGAKTISAVGWGGQRLFIVPSLDLVAVVTAGLYLSDMQRSVPLRILNNYILSAAERR